MTHYIVINEKEIVKAEMERPMFSAWEMMSPTVNAEKRIEEFKDHCLSLPRIPAPGHKWKLWQEVPESDIRFQKQVRSLSTAFAWEDDDGEIYKRTDTEFRRIVAMPKKQNKVCGIDCGCTDHCEADFRSPQPVAIPIQPTPEPLKIKKMTITEKKQPRFGVNDDVYILDNEIYDTPKWIHGVVEEVGEETILVKWEDLTEPTEYELSDLPDIRHIQPTPEGEKVFEDLAMHIQQECHKTTEYIMNQLGGPINIQDATNVFMFRKLAELQLRINQLEESQHQPTHQR